MVELTDIEKQSLDEIPHPSLPEGSSIYGWDEGLPGPLAALPHPGTTDPSARHFSPPFAAIRSRIALLRILVDAIRSQIAVWERVWTAIRS